MKKVIFNADDLGLTKGTNKGIEESIKKGVVRSTTVMVNMPYALEGIKKIKSLGIDSIGIHLNLTCGKPTLPINEVNSLVDINGNFYRRRDQLFPKMLLDQVKKELENQIQIALNWGLKPSHLDSHHHIHMYEGIRDITVELALKYGCALRYCNYETKELIKKNGIKTTDYFTMEFYANNANFTTIKNILENFEGDTIEFMTHPSVDDEELRLISSYNVERIEELKVLTDPEVLNWITENEFEIVGYNSI